MVSKKLPLLVEQQKQQDQLEKCPQNLLEEMDSKKLNYWLAVFLVETRMVTGESYPPTTLHSIMSGLLRYMRTVNAGRCPNFFARNNADFVTLQNTMDSVFRTLRKEGIGSEKKQQSPFRRKKNSNSGPLEHWVSSCAISMSSLYHVTGLQSSSSYNYYFCYYSHCKSQ